MMRFLGTMLAGLGLMLAGAGSAQAAWWQAKTQHFTVYREGGDAKLREFAEKLEKFDFLLRTVTKVTNPQQGSPVKVYILSSESKVRELARNPNIGGFYTTSDRSAFAVLSRGEKANQFDFGAQEILFHEYTHHFMLHHFPAAYPAWYVEGFAEFFSIVKFPRDGSIEFGHVPLARAPGLVMDRFIRSRTCSPATRTASACATAIAIMAPLGCSPTISSMRRIGAPTSRAISTMSRTA